MSTPQQTTAAAQRAQVARALQTAQRRTKRTQKGREGDLPVSPKLIEPTFRGPRSVMLYLGGVGVAVPAGSKVAIGDRHKSAIVLDAEKLVHLLTVSNGRVMEITDVPQAYRDDIRRRAFP